LRLQAAAWAERTDGVLSFCPGFPSLFSEQLLLCRISKIPTGEILKTLRTRECCAFFLSGGGRDPVSVAMRGVRMLRFRILAPFLFASRSYSMWGRSAACDGSTSDASAGLSLLVSSCFKLSFYVFYPGPRSRPSFAASYNFLRVLCQFPPRGACLPQVSFFLLLSAGGRFLVNSDRSKNDF